MNIFDLPGWNCPVTILGCGPSGAQYLRALNGFIIVVNRAVEIYPKATVWICRDAGLATLPWFVERATSTDPPPPPMIFCSTQIGECCQNIPFSYPFLNWPLGYPPQGAIFPGYIRGGGTVIADAIQIAVQKGATRIALVGVDMQGAAHSTGETASPDTLDKDCIWIQRNRLDFLIKWVHSFGKASKPCQIYSLGATALKNTIPITPTEYGGLFWTS